MGPKVEAAITFLERGGSEVLITSPANLEEAFAGRSGTRIVADAAVASVSPSGS
jgi:carbamate kinase